MTEYAMDARTKTNRAMESVGDDEDGKPQYVVFCVWGGGGGGELCCCACGCKKLSGTGEGV